MSQLSILFSDAYETFVHLDGAQVFKLFGRLFFFFWCKTLSEISPVV